MNDVLNFIIRGLSQCREELKAVILKMERFLELQILEGFKIKRKYKEAMQDLEDHFRFSFEMLTKLLL